MNSAGDTKYKMEIYDASGRLETTLYFDIEYEDIFFYGDMIVIYNASSAMIFADNGNLKYQGDFEEAVLLMIPAGSGQRYILVMKDEIQTIILR